MQNIMLEIAHRHNMTSFEKRINDVVNSEKIKIAFIGAFSAGKTSLINAMLGLKLPVSIKPTTKSICLIEPQEGIVSNEFFVENGMERRPVSFDEFQDVVNGDITGVAGVLVKPSENLPAGCVFLDTPGIDNAGSNEGDLTSAYLQFMDAAVVCIDVKDGTIKNHLLNYLKRPELESIKDSLVFVLTHSDPQVRESHSSVASEIAKQVTQVLNIQDAKQKIVLVDSLKDNVSEIVRGVLNDNVLNKRASLLQEREKKDLRKISLEMIESLSSQKRNLSLDTSALDEQCWKLKKKISAVEADRYNHEKDLEKLQEELIQSVSGKMLSYAPALAATEISDLEQPLQTMMNDVNIVCNTVVGHFLKNYELPKSFAGFNADVQTSFDGIEHTKSMAVTVATAVAVAAICPAVGVAGNAAEAAAGGAVKVAAANAAKSGAVKAFFGRVATGLATVVNDINPLEYVGSVIARKVKESSFESMVASKSKMISESVVDAVKQDFYRDIISPIENSLAEEMKALETIKEQKEKGILDFRNQIDDLEKSITLLKNL